MSLFRKRDKPVQIRHFAPDLAITPVDYQLPIQDEQRIQMAEKRIRRFLAETSPDQYCERFFDSVVTGENERLIRTVLVQTPDHLEVNRLIAENRRAEFAKVKGEIAHIEELIGRCQDELSFLDKVYAQYNGPKQSGQEE